MRFKESYEISDAIKYHQKNKIPLNECIFRICSEKWDQFFESCRKLHKSGKLTINEEDKFILENMDTGKTGMYYDNDMNEAKYQGKKVSLDSPSRTPSGDSKKYQVYVNSGRKDKDGNTIAKRITWGDPNLKIKNFDDKARKSFLARHNCSEKNDKTKAGWWACNVHRFAKQLGLSSTKPW
jgi:hypothetical protein